MPARNTASRFVQYATFSPEEREKVLGPQTPNGITGSTDTSSPANGNRSRSRLLKSHACAVRYPDGTEGICRYTREGPTFHIFAFEYKDDGQAVHLPRQHCLDRLDNAPDAIERKARELADAAFAAAIRQERQDYFCRATENASRQADPKKYQMSAKRAKEVAGRYALCIRLGKSDRLLPDSPLYDSVEQATAAWRERDDPRLVLACGNRLDRCWEEIRFHPLRADERYGKQ